MLYRSPVDFISILTLDSEHNGHSSSIEIPVVISAVSTGVSEKNYSIHEPPKTLPLQKPKRRMLPKTPVSLQ